MAKVLVICGSAQKDSLNLHFARFVEKELSQRGAEVSFIHLGDEKLPSFEGYNIPYPPRVNEVLKLMTGADGFYFVIPEYHRSVPSAFKNLLEYIDGEEDGIRINDRLAALITVTAGSWGQWSQMTLLGTLRALYVWLLPDEMYISHAQGKINEKGEIMDAGTKKRLLGQIERFLKAVELLAPLRQW